MSKFYVYSLRRENLPVYVGCTSEKNINIRKKRHIKKITNTRDSIVGDEDFVIEDYFETESMALSYEMALSCYYNFSGLKLFNKKFGTKNRPEISAKGRGFGKIVSDKSKTAMSESRKKIMCENKHLRDLLVSFSVNKRKKVYRSDGHIYPDVLSCKKDLRISSKRFKQLIEKNLTFKGWKISFSQGHQ